MRHSRFFIFATLVLLAVLHTPATSFAQATSNYSVGLMLGLGGSAESNPDTGIDNFSIEGIFSYKIDRYSRFRARVGQLDLETDFGSSELNYLTLSGEYLVAADNYESGLFIGLGLYDLGGGVGFQDDNALGLTLGVTGDFYLSDRFSLLVEFSGHYADFDSTQFFVTGHAGVLFHF